MSPRTNASAVSRRSSLALLFAGVPSKANRRKCAQRVGKLISAIFFSFITRYFSKTFMLLSVRSRMPILVVLCEDYRSQLAYVSPDCLDIITALSAPVAA